MLNVHAIPSYNPTGEYNACAYLRVINPLAELDRKGKIDLSISKKWNCGEGCDLVYLQRMCGTEMDFRSIVDLVHYCKAQHKRIIYELDDNLLDLDNI